MRILRVGAVLLGAVGVAALVGCTHGPRQAVRDRIVIAVPQEPDSLDPRYATLAAAEDPIELIYDGLIRYGRNGAIEPDLAIAVPTYANRGISADGKTITYRLRRGVRWHDGEPFTAHDVVFTWKSLTAATGLVPTRAGYAEIRRIDVIDDWTLKLRMRRPYAGVQTLFALGRQGAIVPAHATRGTIGTGPYRLLSWSRGDAITLERSPYAPNRSKFQRVVLHIYPSEESELNALQSGEADAGLGLGAPALERIRLSRSLRIFTTPSHDWEHVSFNLRAGSGPQTNLHVRRAVAYALDVASMRARFFSGMGGLAPLDQAPSSWARDPQTTFYPHDLNAARAELERSGIPRNQRSLTLVSTAGNDDRERLELGMQAALHDAGIDLHVKNVSPNLLLSRSREGIVMNGNFELALFSFVATTPDPDDSRFVSSRAISPKGANVSGFSDPRVDEALDRAVRTYDRGARTTNYRAIQRRLIAALPFYTLWWSPRTIAARRDIVGPAPVPVGSELWNLAEWARE